MYTPRAHMYKMLIIAAAALYLNGCSTKLVPAITPYKMDIQQGNHVSPEALAKIKPGMTKSQVRFALGTPLVNDPFHANRWDYIYRLQKRGRLVEEHKATLIFDGDILTKIDTDIPLPPPAPEAAPETAPETAASAPATPAVTSPLNPAAEPAPKAPTGPGPQGGQ